MLHEDSDNYCWKYIYIYIIVRANILGCWFIMIQPLTGINPSPSFYISPCHCLAPNMNRSKISKTLVFGFLNSELKNAPWICQFPFIVFYCHDFPFLVIDSHAIPHPILSPQVSYYDQMTACENKQEKLEQIACEVHERRVLFVVLRGGWRGAQKR